MPRTNRAAALALISSKFFFSLLRRRGSSMVNEESVSRCNQRSGCCLFLPRNPTSLVPEFDVILVGNNGTLLRKAATEEGHGSDPVT